MFEAVTSILPVLRRISLALTQIQTAHVNILWEMKMADNTSEQVAPTGQSSTTVSFYRVPKWLARGVIVLSVLWSLYKTNDWWQHVDWPPADQRNAELVKSLNCNKNRSYLVTKEMLRGDKASNSFQPVGVDRLLYIESPACAAVGLYLSLEGTGVRADFNIYDMTTKRKTANIVVTHERFDHK